MKILVAVPLFSFLVTVTSAQPTIERRFADGVSQERLLQTVRDLVGFGPRQGGTRSGDASVSYLVKQFRQAGLKTEILEDPEHLTFGIDTWALRVVKPRSLAKVIRNEWLAGYSPSVSRQRARLSLQSSSDDFEKQHVESTAVLVEANLAGKMYGQLAAAGARCLLVWTQPNSDAYKDWAQITSLPRRADNPIPVFNISRNTAHALQKAIRDSLEVLIEFSTKTKIKTGKSKTVIATLQGQSKDYYVVCAHGDSDSGGPGADDNASGVAGVLELAKVLNLMVRSKSFRQPDSTIKFVVWGSEYASSENFVKQQGNHLRNIVGVLNFDEIGTGATRNCIYFEGNDNAVNQSLLATLKKVGEDYVGKKSYWKEATTNASQGGTDSYVFLPNYLSRLGVTVVNIPSVTVYTAAWEEPRSIYQPREWRTSAWKGAQDTVVIDYSLYYHSSLDIPALTTDKEPFNMVWGVKAVGIALLRLAWK